MSAEKKTKTVESVKVKKLPKNDLEKLVGFNDKHSELKDKLSELTIRELEIDGVKRNTYNEIRVNKEQFQMFSRLLQETYGESINIDIKTGVITEVEKEVEEK